MIADTGEGIAPDVLRHVFDRFRQADGSMTRRAGGLGLGLALVRALVELHGGSVRAESAGGGAGSTFATSLPLDPLPQQAGVASGATARAGTARCQRADRACVAQVVSLR